MNNKNNVKIVVFSAILFLTLILFQFSFADETNNECYSEIVQFEQHNFLVEPNSSFSLVLDNFNLCNDVTKFGSEELNVSEGINFIESNWINRPYNCSLSFDVAENASAGIRNLMYDDEDVLGFGSVFVEDIQREEKIEHLEERIDELEKRIENIDSEMFGESEKINNERIEDLEKEVNLLEEENNELEGNISSLRDEIDSRNDNENEGIFTRLYNWFFG